MYGRFRINIFRLEGAEPIMKFTFATILFFLTVAHAADLNVPKLPTPLNTVDTFDFTITLIEHTYDDVVEYAKAIQPIKIDIQPIVITRYEIKNYDDVLKYAQSINPDIIIITKIEVNQYGEVVAYGLELSGAIKSVRVSHYIQSKDYANLRAELKGVIPADKVEALVGYMQGTVKTEPKVDSTFTIWKGYQKRWYYDLLINSMPPIDENSFIAINDLKLDYKTLYDKYFNAHTGKTKIIWNWNITRDNYMRQEIPNFVSRYKDKIHSHMTGGDYFNSFDYEPPYDNFFEGIRQNIVLIYAGDINARIELCVAYPESVNGNIWLNTMLPYLDIQGLAVWGYHKKTQNQKLTLSVAMERLRKIEPSRYITLIGQFTGVDIERAKIAEELGFKEIQFQENPM